MAFLGKLFGVEDPAKAARPLVEKINELESDFEKLSGEQLVEKTREWQKEISKYRNIERGKGGG